MSMNRRFVLKGMALSGVAGMTMGSSLQALASGVINPSAAPTTRPVLALVAADAAEPLFLQGASAAAGSQLQVQRLGRELDALLGFEQQLRSGKPMRVIGLLDDARASLVLDMARSAGARVQWVGQHNSVRGTTRHHLLSTSASEGCSRRLGRQLNGCGAGFQITEERQGSRALPRQMSAPARTHAQAGDWAVSVGYLLASLGARPAGAAPSASVGTPLTGSFVSFSIET